MDNCTVANIMHGDCLDVMQGFPENHFDSCVCDPPYHLQSINKRFAKTGRTETSERYAVGAYGRHAAGFMGKLWDGGDVARDPETWAAVLRILKPGGHLVAFGGTRTHHRVWCAIEDAGFEIRDSVYWTYGSGFPKSHNVDPFSLIDAQKTFDEWGTALKPAVEPICLARKPLVGTVAENMLRHGVGAINIGGCRVEWPDGKPPEIGTPGWGGPNKTLSAVPGIGGDLVARIEPSRLGRWPANLIHDGSEEVLAAFPQAVGQIADAKTDGSGKFGNVYSPMKYSNGRAGEPSADSDNDGVVGFKMKPGARRGDAGSAARFFYCAKASKSDRGQDNKHPTVKPTDLMRYLCRLVTPPGGLILDPFMGSGSTGKAAALEGFRFIGIEREAEYVAIARARLGLAPTPINPWRRLATQLKERRA